MESLKVLSAYAVPVTFLVIISLGLYREVKVFDVFIDGAKEGIATVIRIIPSLVGLMVAIGVFRASGALDLIVYALRPFGNLFGIPSEVLPMAILRPISGSASLAFVSDTLKENGPDSYIGRVVSTMMGSTETIFYTLTVYFGSVGIKKIRFTLIAALIADTVSVIVSSLVCMLFFGK